MASAKRVDEWARFTVPPMRQDLRIWVDPGTYAYPGSAPCTPYGALVCPW